MKIINKDGISLLEILVSTVILAIVLSQSLYMEVAGYKMIEGAHRAEIASNLAKETLSELRVIPGAALEVSVDSSDISFENYKFKKRVEITNYATGTDTKNVKVTVSWTQGGSWKREVTLEGVIQ